MTESRLSRPGWRFLGVLLLLALLMAAVAIAVAVVAIGQVWAGYVEMLRLGNGHLSYRARRIPWGHHLINTIVLFLLTVWCMGLLGHSRMPAPVSEPAAIP